MSGEEVSRRALLGAAVGLPLMRGDRHCEERSDAAIQRGAGVGTGLLRSARNDEWDRALVAFQAAEAEVRAYEARCSGRPFAEQEALQGGYDARCEAMAAALERLLRAPAPGLATLALKVELVLAHQIDPHCDGAPGLAAIRRDALRLADSATVA